MVNKSTKVMRLEINGRWSPTEMAKSFSHLEDLYNLRLVLQACEDWPAWKHTPLFHGKLKRCIEPRNLSRISGSLRPGGQLEIRCIRYGSPGFKDLAGLGEIVGHVKDFVLKIIEHWSLRRQRDLENEERELKNQRLRIENARQFVILAKECGCTKLELRQLINWVDYRQDTFVNLVNNAKICSVKILSEKKESGE